jgi:hypothetical protein
LKINEELLTQEKDQHNIDNFNQMLSSQDYHYNMLMITLFTFINLYNEIYTEELLIKEKIQTDIILLDILENYHKFQKFNFFFSFKLISNLINLNINNQIKDSFKSYYNFLITYVCWREGSLSFFSLTSNHQEKNDNSIKVFYIFTNKLLEIC